MFHLVFHLVVPSCVYSKVSNSFTYDTMVLCSLSIVTYAFFLMGATHYDFFEGGVLLRRLIGVKIPVVMYIAIQIMMTMYAVRLLWMNSITTARADCISMDGFNHCTASFANVRSFAYVGTRGASGRESGAPLNVSHTERVICLLCVHLLKCIITLGYYIQIPVYSLDRTSLYQQVVEYCLRRFVPCLYRVPVHRLFARIQVRNNFTLHSNSLSAIISTALSE